jgi:hypothetical protein
LQSDPRKDFFGDIVYYVGMIFVRDHQRNMHHPENPAMWEIQPIFLLLSRLRIPAFSCVASGRYDSLETTFY